MSSSRPPAAGPLSAERQPFPQSRKVHETGIPFNDASGDRLFGLRPRRELLPVLRERPTGRQCALA